MHIEEKLESMGLTLPGVAAPVGAYVPAVQAGNFVYTSGQLPLAGGQLRFIGKVGRDVSEEEGYEAAKICILNALAALKNELGTLDRVERVVKVTGFVNSTEDFYAHAKVVNGASDLLGKLFDKGHARAAVGVAALPLNAAVEIELIAQVTG